MLARLKEPLRGIEGPYILTDRRYEDSRCLHYRYGGFSVQSRSEADGTTTPVLSGPDGSVWTDDRAPVYRRPPWVPELFDEEPTGAASRDIHGYRVTRALHHTGAGGVYLAERISDGRAVVLKESRPHTAFAGDGSSGQDRLRREFTALSTLSGTGVAPEPVELFQEWEHLFLAQEHIGFGPLASFLAARNPLVHGDLSPAACELYRQEAATVLRNLRAAIARCHERGLCYGDVSLTNVLVEPETNAVRLIDFESSTPLAGWAGETPASPGFRPPEGSPALRDPRAFDEFGIASVELALIAPRNILRELNPQALARSTRHTAALLRYPLGDLFERLELPAGDDDPFADPDLLIKQTVRFIENTIDAHRDDRPFPASPEMFATNPWSVAYGVAGVLRGLHRLTGQAHPLLVSWMAGNRAGLDRLPPSLYFGLAGVG